jgi:hypothetical protein
LATSSQGFCSRWSAARPRDMGSDDVGAHSALRLKEAAIGCTASALVLG